MRRELHADNRLLLVVPLLLAATILACALAGCGADGAVPNVVINDPPNNSEVGLAEAVPIRSTATDATGVVKIELWVDEALYTSDLSPVAQGQSPFSAAQNWTPQTSGSHRIVVKAYNAAGNVGESAPLTLIVVSEPPPTPTATQSVGPPPTVTPTAPPPTPTPPPPTPTPPTDVRPEPYTVVNVESDDVLNVRVGAGVAHPIVGTIPPYGMDVHLTGSGQEVAGSLWVPIRYQNVTGWVNSHYLARQVGSADEEIAALAAQIIMAIKHEDLETLASFVHPDKGVRLSPYTYVRVELEGMPEAQDMVFSADGIRDFFADQVIYMWGWFDGTGDPIELTPRQYYDRFIYDVDFARPHVVGFNETIGTGNTINNIAEVYPQAVTIEYHFEGLDPLAGGFDWRSLRLVLEQEEGAWYLVGIVHDEWTT